MEEPIFGISRNLPVTIGAFVLFGWVIPLRKVKDYTGLSSSRCAASGCSALGRVAEVLNAGYQ